MADLPITTNTSALTMTTREIAELTGKEHRNVTRDFEKQCSDLGEDVLKFEHIYLDSYNREQKQYLLDREHTMTLVAGYDTRCRHAIVKRWLELETASALPTLPADPVLRAVALSLIELDRVKTRQDAQDRRLDQIEGRVVELSPSPTHQTVLSFAKALGKSIASLKAAALGKRATRLCTERGVQIIHVPDERYGSVNAYPVDILSEVFRNDNAA